MLDWGCFYEWINEKGYHIYRESNIFRHSKYICSFDPLEDRDSGEIEETIELIKENDPFNFIK